jgi:site-specific DNA-methyltransferase (adenine-specific)
MINQVIHGDCFEVLKTIPDNYFESLITDPPAGISFMGRDWDNHKGGMLNWINWFSEIMNECLRTMKPGACGLVWSIPRTSHWTGMALELAGFRLIDIIHHCQGSGFPKGQDIGKMLDKLAGKEREVISIGSHCGLHSKGGSNNFTDDNWNAINRFGDYSLITAPATPEAKQWDGWKTPALKPAVEGWWLVQKPISESSIARNILKHGVGGLNIEACRIRTSKRVLSGISKNKCRTVYNGGYTGESGDEDGHNPDIGRYPANLILSCGADCKGDNHSLDCPVSVIGEQSGICRNGGQNSTSNSKKKSMFSIGANKGLGTTNFAGDQGTAARYFKQLPFDPETVSSVYYSTKASTNDRSCGGTVENVHPTVKSKYLMKYLIQLITPEGGIVLDPFAGSGTTAIACKELGRNYICIEKEREYVDIIHQRLNTPITERGLTVEEQVEIEEKIKPGHQQLSLF